MRLVGILLITSMADHPSRDGARLPARGRKRMAVLAAAAGGVAVAGGLGASLAWDTPSGPSIRGRRVVLFVVVQTAARLASRAQA